MTSNPMNFWNRSLYLPVLMDVLGNDFPYFPVPYSRFANLNGLHECIMRRFHELLRLTINFPNREGLVQIPVVTIQVHRDIYVHNVAILQLPGVRYAVAYHLMQQ